jgi:hypothetical protein
MIFSFRSSSFLLAISETLEAADENELEGIGNVLNARSTSRVGWVF